MTLTARRTEDPVAAAQCLLAGGVVAIPTETVYGLAAVATHEDAVRKVFEAKGRPAGHPLIVHVSSLEMALEFGDFDGRALALARRFWPGPLTIVVEKSPLVPPAVTGGRDTVAIRVPRHALALETIRLCGTGLVAPSANRFGHVSPTTAQHVLDDLGNRIDMVLDGGPCEVGIESTIVECTGGLQVLRPGAVSAGEIEQCAGESVVPVTGPSRAAGMLASHYAPRARVVPVDSTQSAATATGELAPGTTHRVIGAGMPAEHLAGQLYRLMRQADDDGIAVIFAVLPQGEGIAAAVRDRILKAAGGRSAD